MNARNFAAARVACMLLAAAMTGGCAVVPMGEPVANIETIQKAKASGVRPVALGRFQLAPGKDPAIDQKLSVRSNAIHSPFGGSFAAYLKKTLETDLAAAGLLDPTSPFVIDGELLESQLDVPVGAAQAAVAARFVVKRAGVVVYDKVHRATSSWTAAFVGAEAIPDGINRYGGLHRKVAAMLLEDPEFRSRVGR